MALQVRRGTNAERLGITPAEGELIYVTDTKQLYVGDGTTAGGTTTIAGTIDSVLADSTPQLGGNLDLNSYDITGTGNINITGTITATGNINLGDDVGDIIALTGAINGNIVPDTDVAYNIGSPAKQWNNAWFSQLQVENQLNVGRIQGDLIADDSTVVFNAATGALNAQSLSGVATVEVVGNLTGNTFGVHTGPVIGDLKGSIAGDDSTILIDSTANSIVGPINSTREIRVTTDNANNFALVTGLAQPGAIGPAYISRSSNGTVEAPTALVGATTGDGMMDLQGQGYDGASYVTSAIIRVATDLDSTVSTGVVPGRVMFITANSSGNLQNLLIFNSQGKLGLGTPRPDEKLHVANGNAKVDGFVQFGSLTTTERDALTPANGMVIYNETDNKFQGYENGAWANLI